MYSAIMTLCGAIAASPVEAELEQQSGGIMMKMTSVIYYTVSD